MPSVVKEAMLQEVRGAFEANPYIFVSSFEKFPVAEMMDLRRQLEKHTNRSMVVKHSMARKILAELKMESLRAWMRFGTGRSS
jgi:ribosomal protein L10